MTDKCENRIDERYASLMETVRAYIWAWDHGGDCPQEAWEGMDLFDRVEACQEDDVSIFAARRDECPLAGGDLPRFNEYGLSFDYVEPDTFDDQPEGFFRWQLSWGGPSDEVRFYVTPGRRGVQPYRIEYWFMDWFDGACRTAHGRDEEALEQIWGQFDDYAQTLITEEALA